MLMIKSTCVDFFVYIKNNSMSILLGLLNISDKPTILKHLKDIIKCLKEIEIEKTTKHLNTEMDEASEEFYNTNKKKKEKGDDLSL